MEQGQFGRALPVFQAVLPLIERPIERLFVVADIARAAGGVGDAANAEAAAADVWRWAAEPELEPGAARALIEVARGYISLGYLENAEAAASRSLELAIEHRESKIRFEAEALLDSIRTAPRPVSEPASQEPAFAEDVHGDQLAADFVRTLETVAGAAL